MAVFALAYVRRGCSGDSEELELALRALKNTIPRCGIEWNGAAMPSQGLDLAERDRNA